MHHIRDSFAFFASTLVILRTNGNPSYERGPEKIDVPTLILHGDVDQIVLIGNAYRSSKLILNATLKVYPGAPHAMISTSKSQVNEDLLAFVKVGQGQNKAGSRSPDQGLFPVRGCTTRNRSH